jgi:hypothetical protein
LGQLPFSVLSFRPTISPNSLLDRFPERSLSVKKTLFFVVDKRGLLHFCPTFSRERRLSKILELSNPEIGEEKWKRIHPRRPNWSERMGDSISMSVRSYLPPWEEI